MNLHAIIAAFPQPSPRRLMLELLLLWLATDVLLLLGFSQIPERGYLAIIPLRPMILNVIMQAQLTMAIWWLLAGSGRWSDRVLFLSLVVVLFGISLRLVIVFLTDLQGYPAQLYAATMMDALVHGVSMAVVMMPFRLSGARAVSTADPEATFGGPKITLADLFGLTTAAAMFLYAFTVPEIRQYGLPFSGQAYLTFHKWIFIPATLLTLFAVLSHRRPFSYGWWVAAPLFVLVSTYIVWRMEPDLAFWATIYLAAYPLALIASFEYLAFRGYQPRWAARRQHTSNADRAANAAMPTPAGVRAVLPALAGLVLLAALSLIDYVAPKVYREYRKAALLEMIKRPAPTREADRAARDLATFGPEVVDDLIAVLVGPDGPRRHHAITALKSMHPPAVERLVDLLAHEDPSVATSAAVALRECEGQAVVAVLAETIANGNEQVIEHAASVLWWRSFGAKAAVPNLIEFVACEEHSDESRLAVARAVLKIDPGTAQTKEIQSMVPVAIRALDQGAFKHQGRAAEVLGGIGPPAREALPLLRKRTEWPESDVDTNGLAKDYVPRAAGEAIAAIEISERED